MGEKTKRFMQELKKTLSALGSATSKTLTNLEKADHEIQEKIKKATRSTSNY